MNIINDEKLDKLKQLYNNQSKHSNYQILPDSLNRLIGNPELAIKSRNEKERLAYIKNKLSFPGKTILDIGGNTGFFSIEALDAGAKSVLYYEGNKEHADFVNEAASLLNYSAKLSVVNKYFNFDDELQCGKVDITFLLNVLHHIGDDYGDKNLSIKNAKKQIINSLKYMSSITNTLVFQLGYCWKGNRNYLFFENGTKSEMIDFIKTGINNYWEITDISIPVLKKGKIIYEKMNEFNLERIDEMGEFLNRPMFLMKAVERN